MPIQGARASGYAVAMILATAPGAFAQQGPQTVGPGASLAPIGIRFSSFLFYPQVTFSAERNDNALARPTNEQEDTIYTVSPSFRLQSDWNRHSLGIAGSANFTRYDENDLQDTDTRRGSVDGQFDALRDTSFLFSATSARNAENRLQGVSDNRVVEPINYDEVGASVGVRTTQPRFDLFVQYTTTDFNFDDGLLRESNGNLTPFDQDDRDMTANDVLARIDGRLGPGVGVFASATWRKRDFDQLSFDPVTSTNFNRDSTGFNALVGGRVDITNVATGEIGFGFSSTEYDDSQFGKAESFATRGQIDWNATPRTTVSGRVLRDVVEPIVSGAAGVERTAIGATIDYELLRNLVVSASADFTRDDHNEIVREDERQDYGVRADYYFNRVVRLGVAARRVDSDSNLPEQRFTANILGVSLTIAR